MSHLDEIVKVVIYKSREIGNPVTETLAAFIAQTLLNPRTGKFFSEEKLNEQDIQTIIDLTLQKLSRLDIPSMKTIQMQIQYDTAFIEFEYRRQEKLKVQSQETSRLIDEIMKIEAKSGKDFEGLTLLYKRIFNYLLYKNKEVSSNQSGYTKQISTSTTTSSINVEKEVAAALESVIPRAALPPFITLSKSEKVTQLAELCNLVIGIRLFNKEIEKGGASLASLKDLVEHDGRSLLDLLKEATYETVGLCDNYTVFFNNEAKLSEKISSETLIRYKDELVFLRQYLSYLLTFQDDVEVSENVIEANQTRYLKEVGELKNLLGNKSSAPKEQVYPKFASISQAYIQLVEEKAVAMMRVELFNLLVQLRENFTLTLKTSLIEEARKLSESNQDPSLSKIGEIKVDPHSGITRLLPNNTPDFMQTPLDYLGFCIWSIVDKNGLLIPGKPSLGVYRFKEKHCVFTGEKQIRDFLDDPAKYFDGVINQCRKNPELIHLLRLDDVFKHISILSLLQSKEGGPGLSSKLMVDKSLETPTHFNEKNLDPNYCWNEWELRKKAIQMANIRNMQTKACQTTISNFKVDSETQVWLKKDKETNTGINKGTNPLRPRNYIVGLRDKNVQ